MAPIQYAHPQNTQSQDTHSHNSLLQSSHLHNLENAAIGSTSRSIPLEHVSVSQLLGRDYVFIDTQYSVLPTHNPELLHSLLDDLIIQLDLVEARTVAISVREISTDNVSFTRHDLTWHKHKVSRVESADITQPEQHEFMDMIWRCSSSAISFK